jgi:centromeric protein E
MESDIENKAPENDENVSTEIHPESEKDTPSKGEEAGDVTSKENTPSPGYRRSSSVNMKKMQKMFQNAAEENVRSIRAYVTELKERVAKLQYQKQLLVCQVHIIATNFSGHIVTANSPISCISISFSMMSLYFDILGT